MSHWVGCEVDGCQQTTTRRSSSTIVVRSLADSGDELAHVVHDLKNPLSSIALEIELLATTEPHSSDDTLSISIERMRRNVWFLDRLVYNLVDLCSLADDRLGLCRRECDLGSLVAAVVDRVVAARVRQRVIVEREEECAAMIDPLRIERVVANLIDNALKYTPANGTIVARTTRDASHCEVSVCDTGPGLSADELATLFEPYRRGRNALGREGTGLGLYVSKRLVEAHGGVIGVESIRGLGTRFFFRLPAASRP